MTFTNTKNVGKVVCKHLTRRMKAQLFRYVWNRWGGQMNVQVHGRGYNQINPIKTKISQEIKK